jgi:hypothetical protein
MACDPPAEVQIGYLGEAVPESDLDQVFLTSRTGTLCSAAIICQSIVIEGTICPFHISHIPRKGIVGVICSISCAELKLKFLFLCIYLSFNAYTAVISIFHFCHCIRTTSNS